ncbi:MAG: RsmB/NOP family class I SAM-dependent RNA methyltransferase [Candidatus Micrarchaeota archaeon]
MNFPELFKERYCQLVNDQDSFLASLSTYAPKSFRVNTIKSTPEEVKERFGEYGIGITQMKWYQDAFISDEPNIGSTLEHFLGQIYLQELVSMLPPVILQNELKNASFVLDGCAAPGSKTTQIAAIMKNNGTVVANDLAYSRIRALKFNIEKTGALNTMITNRDLLSFPNFQFDAILLDAPCSAEGTIRKNNEVILGWNKKEIDKQSRVQKSLIVKSFDLLAPGGSMVYSTCTFAPEENEASVDWLLKNRDTAKLEQISLDGFKLSPALETWEKYEFDSEVSKTARIWPHENNTGGFYLAKITKV